MIFSTSEPHTVENMKVAAFFAGIAGFELGLERAGHETVMFCEIDPCARAVLEHHFDLPIASDIRRVRALPRGTELVTAGFPCQDLSQVGSTNGIRGPKSGVVSNLVRLLRNNDVPHVLIENVPFMLHLHQGRAIEYLTKRLESLGYKWAYRVVDARAFGIPQRRERVFLLASKQYDPWRVLFEHSYPQIIESISLALLVGSIGQREREGSVGLLIQSPPSRAVHRLVFRLPRQYGCRMGA